MPNPEELKAKFQLWRRDLHNCFKQRPDTLMDLLDSLSSNVKARSPAELSLNPLFRRDYSALYKATENFFSPSSSQAAVLERQKLERLLLEKITRRCATSKASIPFVGFGCNTCASSLCSNFGRPHFYLST